METISNPIKDFGQGVGEGIGNSVINKNILLLIEKFKNRKLAFIQERSTINKARELLNSKEQNFYKTYIQNKEKQILAVIGLTLRKLDQEESYDRRDNLAKKVSKKYGRKGLHLSYLVQNGVLSKYIINILEEIGDAELFEERLNNFLENLENFVYFVHSEQKSERVVEILKTRLIANGPDQFIISGMGFATNIVSDIFNLMKEIFSQPYEFEIYSGKKREIIFMNRKDEI